MNTALQVLLFDVDGTLADTEDIHRQAFNAAFTDAGLDWNWDRQLYKALLAVTGGKERIRFYLDNWLSDDPVSAMSANTIADLHARKTTFYTGMLADGSVALRPGVERLMREALDAGLRLGLATTTTPGNVTALLQHSFSADTTGWFEVIAAGSVVPNKKPAPDIYNYIMDRMNIAPDKCLAFEDSANGLQSAGDAGLIALVTVNAYTDDHDFTAAALVLDTLGEPGQPCHVIAGSPQPGELVDVAFLRALHADHLAQATGTGQ